MTIAALPNGTDAIVPVGGGSISTTLVNPARVLPEPVAGAFGAAALGALALLARRRR